MNTHAHALWMFYMARGRTWRRWAVFWGVFPDLAYLPLLLAYHFSHGWSMQVHLAAWDWSWQHPVICVPHSLVVCAGGLALIAWRRREWFPAAALGWGTHVLIDAATHVSDAYPIFWPLSDRRFPSVVSYWEPAHYGREFFIVNHLLLATAGTVVLAQWAWRRFVPRPALADGASSS